jgi:hypothetical protein
MGALRRPFVLSGDAMRPFVNSQAYSYKPVLPVGP